MLEKLTPETLALIKSASMPSDINRLLDHCTALEEELKSAQNELSKAARLINCAGPLDYRVQMMKLDYSGQITKLESELKAAQEEMSSHRCLPKKVVTTAINNFRAQLVEALDRKVAQLIKNNEAGKAIIVSEIEELIQTFEAGEVK